MGGKLSKYQKFEVEVISRGEIHGADYNPARHFRRRRKRLKRMLAKHGLVQPLVWNRRTGNLVSGHQRLSQLDQLERSQDYDLQVSVVDVDEREEKILNVQLNNPSMQGDWDMDKLNGLAGENGIDPEEFGFSSGDISVMFNSDMGGAFSDTEEVAEAKDTLREIKEHRAESTENMKREAPASFISPSSAKTKARRKPCSRLWASPIGKPLCMAPSWPGCWASRRAPAAQGILPASAGRLRLSSAALAGTYSRNDPRIRPAGASRGRRPPRRS